MIKYVTKCTGTLFAVHNIFQTFSITQSCLEYQLIFNECEPKMAVLFKIGIEPLHKDILLTSSVSILHKKNTQIIIIIEEYNSI